MEPEPKGDTRARERCGQADPGLHALHSLGPRDQGRLTPGLDENPSSRRSTFALFSRLLRFARPYVGVIALALTCSLAFSGARNLRNYLIKPLLNEVLVPAQSSALPSVPSSLWPSFFSGSKKLQIARAAPAAPEEAEARTRLQQKVQDQLLKIALVGLVLVLIVPIVEFGKNYLIEYTLGRILVDIQATVCSKLLTLPLGFHHDTTRGDTISRTLNDVGRAHRSLDVLFTDVIQSILAILVGGVMLISISWQLTLVCLVVLPPVLVIGGVYGGRIRKRSRRRQERMGGVTQRLLEILAGIKVIKAFRAERDEEQSFRRENLHLFKSTMRVVRNRVTAKALMEALNNGFAVGLMLVGTLLVAHGLWGLTVGDLAAFLFVMQAAYAPTKDLSKGWTDLMDAASSAERFFELIDAPSETPDPVDAVQIDGVRHGIRFSKLSFSYGREPVLQDFSLEVKAGEVVAIVGRTGAGKTTLADLLLRFYDPDSGSIEIDGVDLRRISRDSLLQHVAVVTQEPFLFAGTIRDNIRYGRRDASDADVLSAAGVAHVDEFVDALPDGYDTQVGEVGVKLSGGQRQRVTIARAILRNPAILIFDEATSSLDAKSERYVQEAIDALLGGRTVFVIAHRLSTVRHADKIVVLESGTVSRVGTHEELMGSDNLYRELVGLQTRQD
jgi:ATP-binding cassette, subfamily B, bacterial MsbA